MPVPTDILPARTSHSHLFPGATVRVEADDIEWTSRTGLRAVTLDIFFSDGSTAGAELYASGDSGEDVLEVEGYRTAAGVALPRVVWRIKQVVATPDGATLRLGMKQAQAER